mmetsp:Transcript_21625/g.28957  ORF Transcript_21625/g.28957 Transcript_21625/m.28957 type:complete len:88 (-) Transcript_21625:1376-1639(-)
MILGILMMLNTLLFHVIVNFDVAAFEQGTNGIIGLSICAIAYLGSFLQIYGLWLVAIICLFISIGQSSQPRNECLKALFEQVRLVDR